MHISLLLPLWPSPPSLPPSPFPFPLLQQASFLYGSGEFLASGSDLSPRQTVTDWKRSKSMEWGASGVEVASLSRHKGQPVQIDANVRLRKKSGVMVGKHAAQTSRPTILDFGQSAENVSDPFSGGPQAETDTAPDTRPLARTRSLLDDVTENGKWEGL